jgi:hypothetical protein
VPTAEILIIASGIHLADAQLGGDVGRIFDGRRSVGGEDNLERRPLGLNHALGKSADNLKPLLVNVEKP